MAQARASFKNEKVDRRDAMRAAVDALHRAREIILIKQLNDEALWKQISLKVLQRFK